MNPISRKPVMAAAWIVLLAHGAARGEQFSFSGARATGMAEANAASVRDATAQWHSPAAFGFSVWL